jgi:hypothetical protein
MTSRFRFKKADAPTKLAVFAEQPSWNDLASKIACLFHISSPDDVGVACVDRGDVMTVESEEDLRSFYALLPCEEAKFVVHDLRAPDSALSSSGALE